MNLGELIKFLESYPPHLEVKFGIHKPHSYRGYYDRLAFEPTIEITIEEMLKQARECVDTEFIGYKGGEFIMELDTEVYISHYGSSRFDDQPLSESTLTRLFSVY